MNVASTAAFQPGPLMAVYYATKAYVLSLSEAIAEEVRGSGVTVTAFCPGPTASGFQDAADLHESKLVRGRPLPTSAEVAASGYRAMLRGDVVHIPGMRNKLLASSIRFTPRPSCAAPSTASSRPDREATAAHAVNAIPYVAAAPPGIVTFLDLPMIAGRGRDRPLRASGTTSTSSRPVRDGRPGRRDAALHTGRPHPPRPARPRGKRTVTSSSPRPGQHELLAGRRRRAERTSSSPDGASTPAISAPDTDVTPPR